MSFAPFASRLDAVGGKRHLPDAAAYGHSPGLPGVEGVQGNVAHWHVLGLQAPLSHLAHVAGAQVARGRSGRRSLSNSTKREFQ